MVVKGLPGLFERLARFLFSRSRTRAKMFSWRISNMREIALNFFAWLRRLHSHVLFVRPPGWREGPRATQERGSIRSQRAHLRRGKGRFAGLGCPMLAKLQFTEKRDVIQASSSSMGTTESARRTRYPRLSSSSRPTTTTTAIRSNGSAPRYLPTRWLA